MPVNFAHEGSAVDYTPGSEKTAGDVVVQNELVGVVQTDIAANRLGSLAVEGVFDFPKATGGGTAITAGTRVHWDAANSRVSANPTVGKLVGKAVKDAADADASVRVKLTAGADHPALAHAAEAASANVTNTTAETNFDKTVTIPANSLKAGDVIRVVAQAIAPSTNGTDTLIVRLKLGSTTILATATVNAVNNDIALIHADIVIRTIGAGGTLVAAGWHAIGAAGTATARPGNLASTAIDTTAAQVVAASAQWSVASASNQVRLDVLDVQVISKNAA